MDIQKQKTDLLEHALKNAPFDGFNVGTLKQSAIDLGMEDTIIPALFPNGLADIIDFMAQWADDKMLESLKSTDINDLKVRARIRIAVEKRIEVLTPHKDTVQQTFKKLLNPQHARLSTHITWRTADVIWNWAGDDATDYNRYTKRGLLSGVIASTMMYWIQDSSDDSAKTKDFLNNRIENVLFVGKNIGKIVKPLETVFKNFIVPTIKSKTGSAT
jgi:ubiquinone biosynthesis protein COQ9